MLPGAVKRGQQNPRKEEGRCKKGDIRIERIRVVDVTLLKSENDGIEHFCLSLQQLTTLSIHQLERGSNRKFEIANRNGLEKYILQVKLMSSPWAFP